MTHWLDDVVRPRRRSATYRSYSAAAAHIFDSPLAGVALRDLNAARLEAAVGRWPTTRTSEIALIVLKAALSQAVEYGLLVANPAVRVRSPRREAPEQRFLSPLEARRFLRAARADRLYALYHVALDTGMRRGELFALRWADLDLERATVRVTRQYDDHTAKVGPLKTRSARRQIALSAGSVDALCAHRQRLQRDGIVGDLVFPSAGGGYLNAQRVRRGSFLPAQERAGIDPPIRFHDLRHTAATLALAAGVHPKIVSERLGHASIAITLETYQHVMPSLQKEAASRVGALLSGGTAGGTRSRSQTVRKRKTPA